MKENVISFINKLEGFKTAIKNLHWSSSNMSEHKLFDDIASSVSDIQDEVSEMEQGLHGQIEKNKLTPTSYTIEGSQKFLDDLKTATKEFYNTIDGEDYIGIRSSVEAFIGEVDKYKYLMNLCLKEDFKRNYNKKMIKEEITEAPYPFEDGDALEVTSLYVFDTQDGYYEYEATLDYWYNIRGCYYGDEITFDMLITGHSGHGREVTISDEILNFLEERVGKELLDKVTLYVNNGYIEQDDEEDMYEGKKSVVVTESQLKEMVNESIKKILGKR